MPSSANKLTGKKLFQQAVEAFFDDEFEQAESLCTQAIAADSTVGEYYLRRAQIRSKLDNKSMAASDAHQAVTLTANQSDQLRSYFKALYLHGKWAFELGNYDESAESLHKAATINPSHSEIKSLLEKVEPLTTPKPEPVSESTATAADESENKAEPPIPKRPQVRHEWYQTDNDVILEVFIKRVQKDAATVEFEKSSVSLSIKMASGSDNNYEFEPLLHSIVPEESSFEVLSTKIEIRMKKASPGQRWEHLEMPDDQQAKNKAAGHGISRKGVSWDSIAADAERETKLKPSEQNVNELFQSIYKDADEDTRRAMMKSYVESNGTSLSTDWKSVGKGPVETLPPVDAVAKPYDR